MDVVGEVDHPASFVHMLEAVAGSETQRSAAEIEFIFVAVGILDDLADADFAAGIDASLGLAEHLSAILGRGLGLGLIGLLGLRRGDRLLGR